jgi:hypothetical protein
MPIAKSPEAPEWCVYQFEARGIPFYVGIGRKTGVRIERASDRPRWVCSQIKRELAGKRAKWVLHTLVMKALILSPEKIKCRYLREGLCREDALRVEKRRIMRLLATGHVLANVQHNRHPPPSVSDVVRFVWRKTK